MENRKGLSAVVTTLIIILLVLVAVGIIWVVVRNVVETGAEQIDTNTKCIAVNVVAVSVNEVNPGNYTVTLNRKAGGEDIGGLKVNVFNDTSSSGVMDFPTIPELERETKVIDTGGNLTGGDRIEFTVFFLDASGNEQLCTTTKEFTF